MEPLSTSGLPALTGAPSPSPSSSGGRSPGAPGSTSALSTAPTTPNWTVPALCTLPTREPHRPLTLVRRLPMPAGKTSEQVAVTRAERGMVGEVALLEAEGCPQEYILNQMERLGEWRRGLVRALAWLLGMSC